MDNHATNESSTAVQAEVNGNGSPTTRRASARASARRHRSRWPVAAGALQPLPAWVWGISFVLAVAGFFTSNPLLTPCCVMALPILARFLWFKGEPPVLLFAVSMQWVQATAAVFYSDIKGVPLAEEWDIGGAAFVEATWLSLVGVLVLAVGMRLALMRRKASDNRNVERESRLLQPSRIFLLYLIMFVVFSVVGRFAYMIPRLTQPLLATMTLKWVLVFFLAYSVLIQRRGYDMLGVTVCLELFIGVLGYFGGFKSILFILLVALPSAPYFFKGRRLAQFGLVACAVAGFGVVWTAVKGDYREFLNQGTGQQVVLVPVMERVAKLAELAGHLNAAKMQEAWEDTLLRASYVKYFALAMENVPASIPYENGKLWIGAVQHVFMPRLLYPDKPAISDSERTSYYTGMRVAGVEEGTSISIGYMGESYIDFGRAGMFVAILLVGVFYGLIYRFFVDFQSVKVLGFAMATAILIFGAYTIEISNIKLVGRNTMSLLVMGMFAKFGGGMFWSVVTTQKPLWVPRRKRRPRGIEPDVGNDAKE